MYTSNRLFWIRLKHNAAIKRKAWGSVLDWSVLLYIALPAVVILGSIYREAWQETPLWMTSFPWLQLYPIAMLMLMFAGNVRTFIHEADRLFLIQRPALLQGLRLRGLLYTVFINIAITGIPFLLICPFLKKVEGLSILQLSLAYLFTLFLSIVLALVDHLLDGNLRRWRKWMAKTITIIAFTGGYLYPMMTIAHEAKLLAYSVFGAALLLTAAVIIYLRAKLKFEYEVQNENDAMMQSTRLLMSQVIESKSKRRKIRPYIFRRSQRIFASNKPAETLAELRMKTFARDFSSIRLWVSLASIGTYAISLSPGTAALVVTAALSYVANSWLKLQWQQWLADEFIASFKWQESDMRRGFKLSRLWLILPIIALWSAVTVYKLILMLL